VNSAARLRRLPGRWREAKAGAPCAGCTYIGVTITGDVAMFMFKKKLEMPSAAEALPGRSTAIPTAREHFVLRRPLKGPYPDGLETAMFGLGCFWGAERKFWELGDGIYATAVGYAGGHTPNPTYEEVCSGRTGHNEVVLVVYDPKKISYERLLKTFWESHDPTQGMRQGNDVGTQYRSGIYVSTPAQRKRRRRCTTRSSRRAASMPSPPRSSTRPRSISPRTTTSNIWQRTRWAIAGWVAPA
jgi:methionine-S-sulfoxide reductase